MNGRKQKQAWNDEIMVNATLGMIALICFVAGTQRAKTGENGIPLLFFSGLALLGLRFMIRSGKKRMMPGCLWLSMICRDTLIITVLCLATHFIKGRYSPDEFYTLDHGFLMRSRFPVDQIMILSFYEMILSGILLTLRREETRKRTLTALAISLIPSAILYTTGMFLLGYAEAGHSIRTAAVMIWPVSCGVSGALFRMWFGKQCQEEYEARMKAKEERLRQEAAARRPAPTPAQKSFQTPAQPRPQPAVRKPAQPPAQPRRIKEEQTAAALRQSEKEYLKKKKKDAGERQTFPAETLLPAAAQKLYPGGTVLAHLYGQRQLFLWLTALPCLQPMRSSKTAGRLMAEDLADDPERFLPALRDVVREAEKRLKGSIPGDSARWSGLSAETLTGVWFALRMYARMSEKGTIFENAAQSVAEYMDTQPEMSGWLQQFGERRTGDGTIQTDAVHPEDY